MHFHDRKKPADTDTDTDTDMGHGYYLVTGRPLNTFILCVLNFERGAPHGWRHSAWPPTRPACRGVS
jgi:hypothetical protein